MYGIRCIYGIFGREITKYMAIYTVYIYGSGQPYTHVITELEKDVHMDAHT